MTRSRERGLALIAVLWCLVLLSLIAGAAIDSARQATDFSRSAVTSAKARSLAEAGVERAVLALARAGEDGVGEGGAWRFDGTPRVWRFKGANLRIVIQDESGKVDLNRAPEELLRFLLLSVGARPEQAVALAAAIADFRDANDLRRLDGAEDDDYAALQKPAGAKDAPFDRIGELRQVLGMTPALFARLKGLVTVHSGRPGINPWMAPGSVLRALPGVEAEAVARFMDLRRLPEGALLEDPPADIATPEARVFLSNGRPGQAYLLRVEVAARDSVFVREAVVRRQSADWRRFGFVAWEQGLADRPQDRAYD